MINRPTTISFKAVADSPSTTRNIQILGCEMQSWSMSAVMDDLQQIIETRQKCQISYLNADCLNKTFENDNYRDIIKQSHRVFPDGSGVKLACKITGQKLRENLNGTDMFDHICELASERGYRLFFLGAKPGVAATMAGKLAVKYPDLQVAGTHHGYLQPGDHTIVKTINDSRADILFVAMGAPLQETWIRQHFELLDCSLMLGVGGLFDYNADQVPRAPKVFRVLGIEWVWRLFKEPGRMWKRYIIGNPLFVYRIFRHGKNRPSTGTAGGKNT